MLVGVCSYKQCAVLKLLREIVRKSPRYKFAWTLARSYMLDKERHPSKDIFFVLCSGRTGIETYYN